MTKAYAPSYNEFIGGLWSGWGEPPRLHDGGEPGIELLVGCYLVEKAAVDEPDFAGELLLWGSGVLVLKFDGSLQSVWTR
jgi:hypothetical protein